MESDRAAVLIVAAAVNGVVDFRQARLLDVKWWQKLRILIRGLEQERNWQANDARLRYHLALVANSRLSDKSFEEVQETARDAYYDLRGTLMPWEGQTAKMRYRRQAQDARQDYIDAFGVDPASPEYKAWEGQKIAEWMAKEQSGSQAVPIEQQLIERKRQHEATKRQGRRPN